MARAQRTDPRDEIEADWLLWLATLYPGDVTRAFADHHAGFWEWLWTVGPEDAAEDIECWARTGGKALAIDTPIPTPSGWVEMGDVRAGDRIFDHEGLPTEVVGAYPVEMRSCSRVHLSDGTSIVASDDHLWTVLDPSTVAQMRRFEGKLVREWPIWKSRPRFGYRTGYKPAGAQTLTTMELKSRPLQHGRWALPLTPLSLALADLAIDPYLLGYWLGDGETAGGRISVGEGDVQAVVALLQDCDYEINIYPRGRGVVELSLLGLRVDLRRVGVLGDKHVPTSYLRASDPQRRALLAGLLDSDGSPDREKARVEFSTTKRVLAMQTAELARSLGFRTSVRSKRATIRGRDCGEAWRVVIVPTTQVHRLPRKAQIVEQRLGRQKIIDSRVVYIEGIRETRRRPTRCIAVDSPSRLYLAGEAMVPTHNTTTLELACVRLATQGRRYGLVISRTQQQADGKVENVAAKLGESERFALFYPEHADRLVTKYGHSAGWRRSRLRTRGGFTLDAAGLDRALRGLKTEEERPDVIIIDEVDEHTDTVLTIGKHEQRLSRSLLPARGPGAVVIYMQNLVHEQGVMARLLSRDADYLRSARRVGPVPAIRDLGYEHDGTGYRVTAGDPTWPAGFGLERAELELNSVGPSAFLAEYQHEPQDIKGDVFGHFDFEPLRIPRSQVPALDLIVIRIDPAVEGDAESGQGACAVGRDREGIVYFLSGYEGRSSPLEAIRSGIRMAIAEGAQEVGIEDVQGKKTWESVFREAVMAEGGKAHGLVLRRVGVQGMSKPERVSQMVVDFELARVRIVEGSHHIMEAALSRFPRKPNDLADAMWHGWSALRSESGASITVPTGRIAEGPGAE